MTELTEELFLQLVTVVKDNKGSAPSDIKSQFGKSALLSQCIRLVERYFSHNYDRAIDIGRKMYNLQPVLPKSCIGLLAECCKKTNSWPQLREILFAFAQNARKRDDLDTAIGVLRHCTCLTLTVEDNYDHGLLGRFADELERIAGKLPPRTYLQKHPTHDRPRIALVSPALVDNIEAFAKRALQFGRYMDQNKYVPYLYFCEAGSIERELDFPIKNQSPPSRVRGAQFLTELQGIPGVTLRFPPPGRFSELVYWLTEQLEADEIDAVLFQGGVGAPVMWLAAKLVRIPIACSICVNMNMYQQGLDATIYQNKTNLEREKAFWREEWGRQEFLGGGADFAEAAAAVPFGRDELHIPDDAVVFGLLSNAVERRVTPEYMDCVATVLSSCPNSIFLCMGGSDNSAQQQYMADLGLSSQCRWLPRQTNFSSALKTLDFYFNEFPIGGSQVIREALACEVPAIAMKYGNTHAESAAADVIGEPYIVPFRDPQKYSKLAIRMVQDDVFRSQARADLFERAKRHYSAEGFIHRTCDFMAQLCQDKSFAWKKRPVQAFSSSMFRELLDLAQAEGQIPEELIKQTETKVPVLAHAMASINAMQCGEFSLAIDEGLEVFQHQHVLPNRFIGMLADATMRCRREKDLAMPILFYAEHLVEIGDIDQAMAAIKQIYSFTGSYKMLEDPAIVTRVSSALQTIARQLPQPPPRNRARTPGPLRLAMVTVNLLDQVQAYAKTAMQFANHLPRDRFEPYLYFTEATIGSRPQDFSIRFEQRPSQEIGPIFLRELQQKQIKHAFVPPLPFSESASWLASKFEEDEIDAVVFQGGVNATIMWVAANICQVPVKTSLCLGINMYHPGMDATIYMNQTNLDREADFWKPEWGRQVFIGGGADIEEATAAPKPDRSLLGIPEDAITFGILTNYIDVRLTEQYMDCVAAVLEKCPTSYFICMGAGETSGKIRYMETKGVAERCRWPGLQRRPFEALKYLDFYYNEFPIGSSQSIRECMACGIPATAMRYSDKHHESVGADIVGKPYNVSERDPEAFVRRAIEWIQSPRKRQQAAKDLFERACKHYSAATFVNHIAELLVQIKEEKGKQEH